jgi:hypothetical protein
MPYDTNLMFFSTSGSTFSGIAGATTTNQSGSSINLDFGGADLMPITYRLAVPNTTGSLVRIYVELWGSSSAASGSQLFAAYDSGGSATFGAGTVNRTGSYYFTCKTNYRYRRAVISITGSGVWNTGAMTLGADLGGRYTNI